MGFYLSALPSSSLTGNLRYPDGSDSTTGNNKPTVQPSPFLPHAAGGTKGQINALFFSASSFARLTQTGVTAQKTESWHNLEKRQSNEKACYFCPSGSPRHDRLCGIRPSKSAAICYKNSRCVIFLVVLKKTCSLCYCVGQSMFLLTSHQMKIASLTTAGKRDCHFSIPTHSGQ